MGLSNEGMNAACDACKGSCCETMTLNLPADPDVRVWLSLRGRVEGNNTVRLETPCQALDHGKCGIYEARPQVCRDYAVGSPQCIAAIRARRPKDAARLIKLARTNQTT